MITCDNGRGTRAPVPWWVSVHWLAGRQAGAAGVCLSVLLCECTNNARDYCDEAVVLQFSLRSFFWRFVVFESLGHRHLGLTKKDLAEVFFSLLSVWWFCVKQGCREHRMHVFFPFPLAPQSLLPALRVRRKKTSPYNPIPSRKPSDPENPTSFVALAATTPSLPTLKKNSLSCRNLCNIYFSLSSLTDPRGDMRESEQHAERP